MLVAVSGGSDSLGLLQGLNACKSEFGLKLHAATVDHKLRPEARDEAEFVQAFCADRDVVHTILDIDWGEGTKNQARARKLRYRALAKHARHIGARYIITGHTRDDQAETFLIRLNAGSNWWGLAGMSAFAPLPVWPEGDGHILARPFLDCDRESIRAALREAGIDWVDDPSNEDPKYERVRVRALLASQPGVKAQALASRKKLADLRAAYTRYLKDWVVQHLNWLPGGSAQIRKSAFLDMPKETRFRLLQILLPCISGRENTPKTDGLTACLSDMSGGADGFTMTLSGCRLAFYGDMLLITPEVSGEDVCDLTGEDIIWRGRVRLRRADAGVHPTAWAERPVPEALAHARALPFHVRKTLPIFVDARGEIVSAPHFQPELAHDVQDLAPSRLEIWLDAKT